MKPDISILVKTGHFYFGLTIIKNHLDTPYILWYLFFKSPLPVTAAIKTVISNI